MIYLKSHPRAILFTGILYADETFRTEALAALISRFGPLRHESQPVPWHSDHYLNEMGGPVMRQFVFFRELITQDRLKEIKNLTRVIENEQSIEGSRRVNLDPGLLAPARVVLATTKDYAHRIYLGDGIFAETTLIFRNGKFMPGEFAYSDYTQEGTLRMFMDMRGELLEDLRAEGL